MKKASLLIMLFISMSQVTFAIRRTPVATPDSVYICQSRSAYAYHAYECRGLARCTHVIIKTTKTQAIKMGYKACKICY